MHGRGPEDHRGKLKAVARNWVEGRGGSTSTEDDPLTAASATEIERRYGRRDSEVPEIGPDDLSAVLLFLNLSTAWNYHPVHGGMTGLDYRQARPMAEMLEISTSPALLHAVRVMEIEALNRMAVRR